MNQPARRPIYILGAGTAGLAAAYQLTQQGYPVVVVEREERVGGLAKSIEGIPCTEISADWTAQRIKGLLLLKAIRNAILGSDGKVKTLIDVSVFSLLTQIEIWYVWALGFSYFLGLTTNFLLSRRYVFAVHWNNWIAQYAVFAAVALNSLLANLGLLQLLIKDLGWTAIAARLVSAACVALLSYAGHRLYSFAQSQSARPAIR